MIREKLQKIQVKRLVVLNLPYFFIFYVADKGSWLYRLAWEKAWSRDLA